MRHRPYCSESRKEENVAVPEAQYMPMVTPVKPPITSELNKDLSRGGASRSTVTTASCPSGRTPLPNMSEY